MKASRILGLSNTWIARQNNVGSKCMTFRISMHLDTENGSTLCSCTAFASTSLSNSFAVHKLVSISTVDERLDFLMEPSPLSGDIALIFLFSLLFDGSAERDDALSLYNPLIDDQKRKAFASKVCCISRSSLEFGGGILSFYRLKEWLDLTDRPIEEIELSEPIQEWIPSHRMPYVWPRSLSINNQNLLGFLFSWHPLLHSSLCISTWFTNRQASISIRERGSGTGSRSLSLQFH